jgi:hypothetical protein
LHQLARTADSTELGGEKPEKNRPFLKLEMRLFRVNDSTRGSRDSKKTGMLDKLGNLY